MNKTNRLQNPFVVAVLAIVCTFFWGSAFPCIKIGYGLFEIPSGETWTQVLFAGLRFTLAGILTLIIGSILKKKILLPKAESFGRIASLSLFQTILQYIFFYGGLARCSGVKASIIEGSNTFIAILIACLIFRHEKMSAKKVVGCILGFAGVILVNITEGGFDMNMTFMGEGFILLSAVAYAVSSSLIKIYSKYDDPVMLSGTQFFFGGVVMMIMGFAFGGRITVINLPGVMMLIYLAMVSAVAYSIWGTLLKYNPISMVAVYGFMNPVFGVILSAWWLNESGNIEVVKTVVSLLLVCAGIYIVNGQLPKWVGHEKKRA